MLKIEDTVDEEPLSDDNDQENNYPAEYETVTRNFSATSISSNLYVESVPTYGGDFAALARPKTAFKTAFDYDEASEVANVGDKNVISPRRPDSAEVVIPIKKDRNSEEKSEKKKSSKSKDKHHHRHRSSSKRSPSPSSLSNGDLLTRDSASAASMSRVATGDTGYSSSSSSLASLRLKSLDHQNHRQPIIVSSNSSNSLNSSSSNLLQTTMHAGNIKPLNTNTNPSSSSSILNNSFNGSSANAALLGSSSATTSLKQLKSNLGLLSGPIRLPSNNK